MNAEIVRTVRISAREIADKFGLKGEIDSFCTPSRPKASPPEKHLLIKLKSSGDIK